jgi:hypothetical protein
MHVDPKRSEPLADPLAVRIQALAAGELAPNRNHFGNHPRPRG